jgi:hypothetical protein
MASLVDLQALSTQAVSSLAHEFLSRQNGPTWCELLHEVSSLSGMIDGDSLLC